MNWTFEITTDDLLIEAAAADRLEHAYEHPWYRDDCVRCDMLRSHTDEELVQRYKKAKARTVFLPAP